MFVTYINGNYRVILNLQDGTKIRYNKEDKLIPHRPESIDVKITNRCQHSCPFCHENSHLTGKEASRDTMKQFVSTIPAYCEIAVGGGNLMLDQEHTEFFLRELRKVEAIPSITVRQDDFIRYADVIQEWREEKLVFGIGVSLSDARDPKLYSTLGRFPTAVLHVIAGLLTEKDYNMIKNHDIKMLILGYKLKRRGLDYWGYNSDNIAKNQAMLCKKVKHFTTDFSSVSFDNLALHQLHMQNLLSPRQWEENFMGEDGEYTFYVDLVDEKYARSSTAEARFNLANKSVQTMFNYIRSEYAENSEE